MNHTTSVLLGAFGRFFIAALSCAIAIGLFAADAVFFPSVYLSEMGLTEISQEVLLILSASTLLTVAICRQRPGCFLMAGFMYCLFIRELDLFFDVQCGHGSWFYFAVIVATVFLYLAFRTGVKSAFDDLADQVEYKSFLWIMGGMIIVLVFSRLFGMGDFLRLALTGELAPHVPRFKRITEECLELWGYVLVFFGSLGYLKEL